MAQRTVDSKREEYRKYLEKAGVMESLTKMFTKIFEMPEKPTDAYDYVREMLNETIPTEEKVETLKANIETYLLKIHDLEDEVQALKEKLTKYEEMEKAEKQNESAEEPVADSTDENVLSMENSSVKDSDSEDLN